MSNIEGTNIGAQGRASRLRRRRISLAIAGVAVLLVAGTVVIGTQANGSRSGSLLSADCNGVNYAIKDKGNWANFQGMNLANGDQIAALNQCQKFSNWVRDVMNSEVEGALIGSYFWAPDKTSCKVSYYFTGGNYKGTACSDGSGYGADFKYAIVIG